MKKVFSSHASLSHAWANQTHEIGKASAMFFEGPVIYSWGYHYEIARFIEDKLVERHAIYTQAHYRLTSDQINEAGLKKLMSKHVS